jgi:phosphate-selective porin OprO/OprP
MTRGLSPAVLAGILLAGVLAIGGASWAQSTADTVAQLQAQINDLQKRLKTLEQLQDKTTALDQKADALDQRIKNIDRREEVAQQEAKETQSRMPILQASSAGFYIMSPDQRSFLMHIGGYAQFDGRFYTSQDSTTAANNPGATSTFLIRRARPYFEGTVDEWLDYRIQLDFGQAAPNASTGTLQDAYGDIHYWDFLRLRFGKFKEPVGLERLMDDRYLEFVERGYPTQLVADRDIGLQVWGQPFRRILEYQLGVFNGVADNVSNANGATNEFDTNNAKDFAGRVYLRPFAATVNQYLNGLGFGIGGSYGSERGSTVIDTYKSEFQTTVFKYNSGTRAAGDRYRWAPQAAWYAGPFSVLGEFTGNTQYLEGPFGPKKSLVGKPIANQAWQAYATYLLTGEDATANGVIPRHPFDPRTNQWGAFEVGAKIEQLLIDRDAFSLGLANPNYNVREEFTWALGVNWYANRNFKLMVDYALTNFSGGAPKGGDRHPEGGFLSEMEFLY